MKLSEVIKIESEKQGISLCELAEKMGTTKQNLGNKIKRSNFQESDIEKICKILKIKHKYFNKQGEEI